MSETVDKADAWDMLVKRSAKFREARTKIITQDAEITRLKAEVERLVKSRNRWGQKYNKLLSAVRTENAYGVYTEARDEYRRVITEQASEIERLRNDVRLAVMSDRDECRHLTRINEVLIAAPTVDVNVVVPDRDYSQMTPKDCYEAGLMDGVYQAREAIKKAARAALTPSQEPRT